MGTKSTAPPDTIGAASRRKAPLALTTTRPESTGKAVSQALGAIAPDTLANQAARHT